ncbi:MAG: DsbA family protein [Gallionella sp.]|nr:DsbA family protein [Gallionella sp.]
MMHCKNHSMKIGLAVAMSICALTLSSLTRAESLTKNQGDAILKELREIKALLAKPQQAVPAAPTAQERPENLTIKGGGIYVLGKSDAPLTLVEFTDYECPFCKRFYETTFQTLKKNYIETGKLKFISRNMPLPMHTHALKAAQASACAGEQGKFWEMKDLLFRNQNRLEVEALTGYAKDISLNAENFKTCMADDVRLKAISDEASYINSLGVNGTPSFVLGKSVGDSVEGRKIVGAQPLEVFEGAINELLRVH